MGPRLEAPSCQSLVDGGISGEPFGEAHGGFSYCGLAASVLIGQESKLDLHRLAHWLARRQMGVEGGFQGRTHKLVDACYSFWQGASFAVLRTVLANTEPGCPQDNFFFNIPSLMVRSILE
eukprot:GHVU01219944.1.p3 GENE.GHVU01219944.1~~GHVU01219944.1.p3  ORF type:complete len:121 (-),score=13.32 GHVU01219944.1:1663-2025(-)